MRQSALALLVLAAGCGAPLPDDLDAYQTRCARMNAAPLPRRPDDPHAGTKNVYACGVDLAALRVNTRPFPDGAVIVKESSRDGFVWLVATARKRGASWQWDEYTRNFSDEGFRRLAVAQSKCTGCHDDAAGADWIFTFFTAP